MRVLFTMTGAWGTGSGPRRDDQARLDLYIASFRDRLREVAEAFRPDVIECQHLWAMRNFLLMPEPEYEVLRAEVLDRAATFSWEAIARRRLDYYERTLASPPPLS